MEKINTEVITPNLCKAARALLGWKQEELSRKSGVALSTIGFFETSTTTPQQRTLRDIRKAFEEAGIGFKDSKDGVGVYLARRTEEKNEE